VIVFRRRIKPDRHVLDDVRLDAGVQDLPAEADDLDRRLFVEGQGQIEADRGDPFLDELLLAPQKAYNEP
jgi:hypothetical protein